MTASPRPLAVRLAVRLAIGLLLAAAVGGGGLLLATGGSTSTGPADSAVERPRAPHAPGGRRTPHASEPTSPAPVLGTDPASTPPTTPVDAPEPSTSAAADDPAGPALLEPGDTGPEVRSLQARLRQIDWFDQDVTDFYGPVTETAVRGFQAKREIPVTGAVDRETMDRLVAMTTEPTADELANVVDLNTNVPGPLDPRCQTGRALCIDKSTRTLRWVVDGQVLTTVDVRFGADTTPTREGAFTVESKSRDHVSSLFGSAMPFAMFFSGGQAVHYSSDFAARGYSGASHGCVNVRDYDAVAALFEQVQVGDPVIVYYS